MKQDRLKLARGFHVGAGNRRSQAATMTLAPGESEGGPDNRHRGSDQWLYVVAGSGVAMVNGRQHPLKRGVLILVEHGDPHEIRNTGRRPLRTLNFYVPPAYGKNGEPLPPGRG
jgi:mannose-6-phosphate isomerase-like protein (cupin superfamily)